MTLLEEIERFQCATCISDSAFGRRSINDKSLIPEMRAGMQPRKARVEKILAFIDVEIARFYVIYPDGKR